MNFWKVACDNLWINWLKNLFNKKPKFDAKKHFIKLKADKTYKITTPSQNYKMVSQKTDWYSVNGSEPRLFKKGEVIK